MDTDLFLAIGVILGGLAVPSLLNAFSEGRPPRLAAMLALAACACIGYAVLNNPMGYELQDIPDVFVRVVARLF